MVSKCANPDCSASFLYFHQGKLFRLETEGRPDRRRGLGAETGFLKPVRRIEFYWLCEDCAERMTLTFDRSTGMCVRPRGPKPVPRVAATAA